MTIATDFQALGICGYNKIFFGPSMDVKATMEPEYDESKRTVTYYVIHFTFDWWVDCASGAEPSPTDATTSVDKQMEQIRTALMTPGADFQFASAGLGPISVNPAPTSPAVPVSLAYPGEAKQLDPVWGPKPRRMTWECTNAKAAHCTFQIDVALLKCPNVLAQAKLLEFNYSLELEHPGRVHEPDLPGLHPHPRRPRPERLARPPGQRRRLSRRRYAERAGGV